MQIARPHIGMARASDERMLVTWGALAPSFAVAGLVTVAVALLALSVGTVRIAPSTTLAVLLDHLP
ncbi:MAG TPA: hypothetical protein VEC56_10320, partial [Candidatus Krumholzibacteria bacterium]|nr:hypothetical protein [Candidatus Krumholzibacteria bacterium]